MGQGQLREQAALCTGACCSGSVLQLALCLGALQSGTVSTGGQVSLPSCGDLSASIRGAGLSTVSHRRCCVIPQSFHGSAVWPSACSKCKQQQPMAAVEGLLHFSGVCMPGTAGTGLRRGGGSQQLQEAATGSQYAAAVRGVAVLGSAPGCSTCKQQQQQQRVAAQGPLKLSGLCIPGMAGTGFRRSGTAEQLQEAGCCCS